MTSIIRVDRDGIGAAGLEKCSVAPPEAVLSGAACLGVEAPGLGVRLYENTRLTG
ncbi:MAG: hypothetical protein J0H34_22855 [Rhizobiales bacterium]|nr:hypothetical protein [Hyphomicrobiales bacterium]